MKNKPRLEVRHRQIAVALILVCVLAYGGTLRAQRVPGESAGPRNDPQVLTISVQVLGGDTRIPVAGARLYIRTEAGDKDLNDATTNSKGIAVFDGMPRIRIGIQVTATGWETQGMAIDLADPTLPSPIEIVVAPSQSR